MIPKSGGGVLELLEQRLKGVEMLLTQILSYQANETAPSNDDDDIMGVPEICKYLKKEPQTIYHYTSQKLIPYMKVGKNILFSKKEITKWLLQQKCSTLTEINEKADNFLSKRHRRKAA